MKKKLKIISWNCAERFRYKINVIKKYNPDVYIIQECEPKDKFDTTIDNFNWFVAGNYYKGIGIFNNPKVKVSTYDDNFNDFKMVVASVIKWKFKISLLSVWTWPDDYGKHLERAIEYYKTTDFFVNDYILIIGDF